MTVTRLERKAEAHAPRLPPPTYWEPFGQYSAVYFQLIFWSVAAVLIYLFGGPGPVPNHYFY